jgi:hypothetical protein
MSKPFIFGVGSAKTGGHSLAEALRVLGFNAVHLGNDAYWGGNYKQRLIANQKAGGDLLAGFDGVDAVVDSPVWQFFDLLLDQNPDAKFILSYRPPQDAAMSWVRMLHKQKNEIPGHCLSTVRQFREEAERHIDRVFSRLLQDTDRLLVVEMADPSEYKWQQLSDFLGKPLPTDTTTFPHEFGHRSY